ncbi:MAG: hypothetical protein MI975_09200 [Cytophagales bacterium]|nr:hypothetical protein [Cytophagales bacterium]
MKTRWTHKAFSYALLIVYSMVAFREGVINCIHFLSHTAEIISNDYSFHSHGNGSFHIHHHDFMDTVKTILHQGKPQDAHDRDQLPSQQQIKLHLAAYFNTDFKIFCDLPVRIYPLCKKLSSRSPEVITPPPKG